MSSTISTTVVHAADGDSTPIPTVSRPLGLGEGAIFETHVYTTDLDRAMAFYGETLGLHLAYIAEQRRIAFYWIGARGSGMLGVWEVPQEQWRSSHFAFRIAAAEILQAVQLLQAAGIAMVDFLGRPTSDPSVHCWMPACGIFFRDPDGNSLEFVAMLPEEEATTEGPPWLPFSAWCAEHGGFQPAER